MASPEPTPEPTLSAYDPELGPMVAIPEPFWVRTWRTLLRWRPACYSCRETFRTREQWERHWLNEHQP
jgi:hypothetical protein